MSTSFIGALVRVLLNLRVPLIANNCSVYNLQLTVYLFKMTTYDACESAPHCERAAEVVTVTSARPRGDHTTVADPDQRALGPRAGTNTCERGG